MRLLSAVDRTVKLIFINEKDLPVQMPIWAKWFAVDADGTLAVYRGKPYCENTGSAWSFSSRERGVVHYANVAKVDLEGEDWRDSLVEIVD